MREGSLATAPAKTSWAAAAALVPGRHFELARAALAAALARAGEPVGMVERLHGGLSAGAQPASRDGVERIALDLLDGGDGLANSFALHLDLPLGFHHAHDRAAAGAALAAHAGMPLLDAGNDRLLGDQQRDDLLPRFAARPGDGAAGGRSYKLEEVASIHGLVLVVGQ